MKKNLVMLVSVALFLAIIVWSCSGEKENSQIIPKKTQQQSNDKSAAVRPTNGFVDMQIRNEDKSSTSYAGEVYADYLDYQYTHKTTGVSKTKKIYIEADTLGKIIKVMIDNQMVTDLGLSANFFVTKNIKLSQDTGLNKSGGCWSDCNDARRPFWCKLGCIGQAILFALVEAAISHWVSTW